MAKEKLEKTFNKLQTAVGIDDVFGGVENLTDLETVYELIVADCDPEKYPEPENKELARDARVMLDDFFAKAKEHLRDGGSCSIFGGEVEESIKGSTLVKIKDREYMIQRFLAEGDLCNVYEGVCLGSDKTAGRVIFKIIADSENNFLLRNELNVLELFQKNPAPQHKHLPVILDKFQTGENQLALILRYIDAITLSELKQRPKYQNGVPARHAVWILERLLSVVGYAHNQGVIHGNIKPANIMIRGDNHNLYLLDWCGAAVQPKITADDFKVFSENFSAPEVDPENPLHKEGTLPVPPADMYSIGKTMIHIMGGNIHDNSFPADVDERLQRFIQYFVRESPIQRARDAWEMYHALKELRKEIFPNARFEPMTF